ncbi:MAG: hypothetical protein ACTSRZ_09740 [Promethearchaeota archaeon]
MPLILIDNSHNEEFRSVPKVVFDEELLDMDYAFDIIHRGDQFPDYHQLKKYSVLILGNILPAPNQKDHLFSKDEIKTIKKFVYNGGNLLITTSAGGDFKYPKSKGSLRVLVSINSVKIYWWGELFHEDPNYYYKEAECLVFNKFPPHPIFNNISKLIFTDCTFFEIDEEIEPSPEILLKTTKNTAFRYYKDYSEYIVDSVPIIILRKFGLGKSISIGSTYFMLDDKKYGIYLADNKIFFANLIKYLVK